MNNNDLYSKLYLQIITLLIILVALFTVGFSLFAIHILKYKVLMSVLCAVVVNVIMLKYLAKLSAIIAIQFSDVEYSDDIPDGKVIRIKDYLRKKVGYNVKARRLQKFLFIG